MIDENAVRDIIAMYERHGWVLRRVLLSPRSKNSLAKLFGHIPINRSDIDAAWFSRPPGSGQVSWEIRYLGDSPFALLESLDEGDAEFELKLKAVEDQLAEKIAGGSFRLTTAAPDSKL